MIFTSDHGYNLGQFGLVRDKAQPYEFDVRVPLAVRGPGVVRGAEDDSLVVASIDLAPTLMEMAEADVINPVDGLSFLPKILLDSEVNGFLI